MYVYGLDHVELGEHFLRLTEDTSLCKNVKDLDFVGS